MTSASSFGRIVSQINLTLDRATGEVVAKSANNRIVTRDVPNPGGIRADIQAGEVTYGELFEVQPFSNTLIVKTCTGAQIEALLEQQWTVANRILQVSNGFTYTWDNAKAAGDRVDPASIRIDGVVVDPAANYRVTMNSFLATGGDRFSVFTQCTNQLGGELDVDALVRYFQQSSPVAPGPMNRITRTG